MVFTETRSKRYWSKYKYVYVKKLLFFSYSEVIIIVWSTLILGSLSMSWGKKLQSVHKLRVYFWLFPVIITLKNHLGTERKDDSNQGFCLLLEHGIISAGGSSVDVSISRCICTCLFMAFSVDVLIALGPRPLILPLTSLCHYSFLTNT